MELTVCIQKKYWIGFNLVKGIGAARLRLLLDYFGTLEEAWKASPSEFRQAGLGQGTIRKFTQARDSVDLNQICRQLDQQQIGLLTWDDPDYPRRLAEIEQAPPLLFVRGDIVETDQWAVAIVGTRRVSPYGRQVTGQLAAELAQNGITVVSGLARGVDTLAHRAALRAGGRTLAVLGSGVDQIYPPENRKLADRIAACGALISDYALGTPPEGVNFPPRNRIISGLSLAVVVIEAGRKSGALITANFAAEQNRDVFAVPGSIFSMQSQGTNDLIRTGARPLTDIHEVLEALDLTRVIQHREAGRALPVDAVESQLLAVIGQEPCHIDEISARAGMTAESAAATLTMLELKGLVRQVGGMNYVR